jgi:hypothetical protein
VHAAHRQQRTCRAVGPRGSRGTVRGVPCRLERRVSQVTLSPGRNTPAIGTERFSLDPPVSFGQQALRWSLRRTSSSRRAGAWLPLRVLQRIGPTTIPAVPRWPGRGTPMRDCQTQRSKRKGALGDAGATRASAHPGASSPRSAALTLRERAAVARRRAPPAACPRRRHRGRASARRAGRVPKRRWPGWYRAVPRNALAKTFRNCRPTAARTIHRENGSIPRRPLPRSSPVHPALFMRERPNQGPGLCLSCTASACADSKTRPLKADSVQERASPALPVHQRGGALGAFSP